MVDWQAIKTEYITTKVSYRQLAEKYGVSRVQIGNVGRDEKWVELRQQYLDKCLTKTLNAMSSAQAKRAARLQEVADRVLNKVEVLVTDDTTDMAPQDLKCVSGVLKDIKEIQMIKSEGDLQEQQARIEKLRADVAKGEENNGSELTVAFEGDMGTYGE